MSVFCAQTVKTQDRRSVSVTVKTQEGSECEQREREVAEVSVIGLIDSPSIHYMYVHLHIGLIDSSSIHLYTL